MTTAPTQSDVDDRTASALSISSHTHVDNSNDAGHPSSPRTKMTAWSGKHSDPPVATPQPAPPLAPTIPDTTASTGRPATRADRPPPPKCMQSCIASIENCTANVVRFNERMEQNRVQAEAQRRESGDPWVARKAIIPMVFVILSWVFLVYVWRLCSRLIQQNPQGRLLGRREEGVGLLVGFVVLWLMTIWSYVTVISKGPGLVKDCVAETDPPLAPEMQYGQWDGAHPQQYQQGATAPMPIPAMRASGSGSVSAASPSASLPYPSFSADLERFGGNRASSDSMRVLPGSVEPKHNSISAADRDFSRNTIDEEDVAPATVADTSATDIQALLSPPLDDAEAVAAEEDPQLPGLIGPLPAAAVSTRQAAQQTSTQPTAPAPVGPNGWVPLKRRPANDSLPLSASALYCHRCRRVKPPRALLGTHVFLMVHNMTTVEHVGISRVQGRERVLVDRWFGMQKGKQGALGGLKQKRKMIRDWDEEWGKLTKEGNRWWLANSDEVHYGAEGERDKEAGKDKQAVGGKRKGAARTNVEQTLGEKVWMWVLPIGKHPNEGLQFPMNPRFGEEGVQRRRDEWPAELR
ncbi:related to Zinc finger DHHC domain containing protein 2 [Ustilago bromivora]|uniref:Related to Zinc finger DHHC domain containing protein 2 n=1 Tax=Ustilago bromivora TaxID=307758 RepID=A0A8H8QNJ0_9BASI|nr:related to Zinc finger DHHC domain containing protein 2 [Ustilago bromivora]